MLNTIWICFLQKHRAVMSTGAFAETQALLQERRALLRSLETALELECGERLEAEPALPLERSSSSDSHDTEHGDAAVALVELAQAPPRGTLCVKNRQPPAKPKVAVKFRLHFR